MHRVSKISLGEPLTVVSGPNPPTPDGFRSTRVQVLHWRVDDDFSDPGPHLHESSDEVYVVLEGSIDIQLAEETIRVGSDEALVVGAGVVHSMIAVQHPARGLSIRGPSIGDKKMVPFPGGEQ